MPRDYVRISRTIWTGETGLAMSQAGALVQLVANYLISGPHWSVLGLYRLPLSFVSEDIRVSASEIAGAMKTLSGLGFAHHDAVTKNVWIVRYLAYQTDDALKIVDKRVKMINKQWISQPWSPWIKPFWDTYAVSHHLDRRSDLEREAPSPDLAKGLFSAENPVETDHSKGHETEEANPYAVAGAVAVAGTVAGTERETEAQPPAKADAAPTDSFSPNFHIFWEASDRSGGKTAAFSAWIKLGYELYNPAELVSARIAYQDHQQKEGVATLTVHKWIREDRREQRFETTEKRKDRQRDESAASAAKAAGLEWPLGTPVLLDGTERGVVTNVTAYSVGQVLIWVRLPKKYKTKLNHIVEPKRLKRVEEDAA